jgi:alanyl-tRNA synthetase
MKTAELRKRFVEFFQHRGHAFVPSSSTIPIGDQTMLFTIAGMVQFKNALTGEEIRPYKRAANYQKCVRVKDLDNVGRNGRHHTFFEMLGNWSFGEYFKEDAIAWAYEFVKNDVKMDMSKIWVSVHTSDDDALAIWKKTGIDPNRLVRLGADNFWEMGPVGPCGPCTELYFDQGPTVGVDYHKRTNTKCLEQPGCECDRFLEFWNLVFMQSFRHEDGSLTDLPFRSVDTGAGLERFAALLQGKTTNFESDAFEGIRAAILNRAEITLADINNDEMRMSLNVVSDHIRMLTFTLADGAVFSNEGRGYVVRRVLRRAVRYAHRLNPKLPKEKSFLADIVNSVVKEFGPYYPEIAEQEKRIVEAISTEELRFTRTLEKGLERFREFAEEARRNGQKKVDGEKVFLLHDSFGFPADLTQILCEEDGLVADLDGFSVCMKTQKEKSRAEAKFYKFDQDDSPWVVLHEGGQKEEKTFAGYGMHEATGLLRGKEIVEIPFHKAQIRRVRQLQNRYFEVVLASTPYYAESGGQIADCGWMRLNWASTESEFEVVDVRKTPSCIVHLLRHPDFSLEDAAPMSEANIREMFSGEAAALLDFSHRSAVARNHTATHLAHKALRAVLGDGVRQAGSLVTEEALRFDFTYGKGMTADEIARVEEMVNQEILRNHLVTIHENVEIDEAKKMGAMAIFDEKYDDLVRVVEVAGYSMELCGGTHVKQTGTIGLFKIVSEGSVTAGVRRIEALTGMNSLSFVSALKKEVSLVASDAGCAEKDIRKRIAAMQDDAKKAERFIGTLESRLVNLQVTDLLGKAREVAPGVNFVAAVSEGASVKELELLTDRLKEKDVGIVVVGAAVDGKAVVIAAVNPALCKARKNLAAGNIVKQVCELVDGKGGGRPDFARGGGNSPEKLPQAFTAVADIVTKLVNA